ncbi:hypothetical protein K402DRAFT_406774 [Aulographum hederae CBS 113979]|uniref:Uncharacterized protein n=1 Tax=Aulographum hederae CBS 113979 TaxID=1176131 RepID=A0A6G1GRU5_9PEZI|nr:hypothetical protein K402DRAFT_406774 [Aulographum hederae CBS 113979]
MASLRINLAKLENPQGNAFKSFRRSYSPTRGEVRSERGSDEGERVLANGNIRMEAVVALDSSQISKVCHYSPREHSMLHPGLAVEMAQGNESSGAQYEQVRDPSPEAFSMKESKNGCCYSSQPNTPGSNGANLLDIEAASKSKTFHDDPTTRSASRLDGISYSPSMQRWLDQWRCEEPWSAGDIARNRENPEETSEVSGQDQFDHWTKASL